MKAQNIYEIIQSAPDISDNDKYYWGYQYKLAEEAILPYLRKNGIFRKGDRAAEIGCAEGGVLMAFAAAGAEGALGTDIAQARLDRAEDYKKRLGLDIEFTNHDIVYGEPLPEWGRAFDLVLLRDVIEHLDDTKTALANIKKIIKPGGFLFVTFPSYWSPFGGHQHTAANSLGKLPFIHYLPSPVFHKLIKSGRPNDVGEIKRLQEIKLTPDKFINAARGAGYKIEKEDYYLLRPVFKMKFGLPAIKLTPFKSLPFVKSVLSLEASYVLKA